MPSRIGDWWLSLNVYVRRRIAVGGALLALVAALAALVIAIAAPGGSSGPPPDDAIGLVPAEALAYLHLYLEPGTGQYEDASEVAGRLPALRDLAVMAMLGQLPGPGGGAPDFERDIRPWFGGQASLALLPARGPAAREVELLQAADARAARAYVARSLAAPTHAFTRSGVEITVDDHGVAAALARGFLVIGTRSAVASVVDTATGARRSPSLAADPAAEAALVELPGPGIADAYLSRAGMAKLVAHPGGALAELSPFLDPGASRGAAAILSADPDGLELEIRSVLDPKRAAARPGFFSAFPAFTPTLDARLPPGTLAYAGFGDPGAVVASLLGQARREAPGLASEVRGFLRRASALAGGGATQLLEALGDEAAVALERGGSGPYAMGLASGVDPAGAQAALTRLEGPIARALGRGASADVASPGFQSQTIAGVPARELQAPRNTEIAYAVFDGTLVAGTDPAAIATAREGPGDLDGSEAFAAATDGFPERPSLIAYLDLNDLIRLAAAAGLAANPAYAALAPDLQRLGSFGLAVTSGPSLLSSSARLTILR